MSIITGRVARVYLHTEVTSKNVTLIQPNDKILHQSYLKAFADDNHTIRATRKLKLVLAREEKTLWEKEKILVTSIFSFSHNVFKRFFAQCVKRRDPLLSR